MATKKQKLVVQKLVGAYEKAGEKTPPEDWTTYEVMGMKFVLPPEIVNNLPPGTTILTLIDGLLQSGVLKLEGNKLVGNDPHIGKLAGISMKEGDPAKSRQLSDEELRTDMKKITN
jgi:hypothetical protein